MKFICIKENLSRALSCVVSVAGKNVNLPILGNVLIKAEEQRVVFVATNLELAIISYLRAKIETPGSFTVPARTLADFVNLLSDEKVEVELVGNELQVVCGRSATKIKGSPADEFPVVPAGGEGKGYVIDAARFKRGLEQVTHAAAKNEIRPELAGLLAVFNMNDSKGLTLAATDSYRLAEKKMPLEQGAEEVRIIIPVRAAQEMLHVLSVNIGAEGEKTVRILVSDNQIVVRFNEVELLSRLVEGNYPDYTQIIPKEFRTTVEFDREKMMKEIKAASIFTTTGVNAISFDLRAADGVVGISSTSTQTGDHKSEINADIQGDNNTILLNHRYVLDGLSNIDSEKSLFRVINADSPCVLAPKSDDSYLYIVMPIRQ